MTDVVRYAIVKRGGKFAGVYYMDEDHRIIKPVEITQIITDGCDCYPWTETFAFFPVKTITGKRIWWKKLYKRKVWLVWGVSFHMEPEVQFATAFDMLQDPYKHLIQSPYERSR